MAEKAALIGGAPVSQQPTLYERLEWKFEYSDIAFMVYACCCDVCGIRSPTSDEGGPLSCRTSSTCICCRGGEACAIEPRPMCCEVQQESRCINAAYDGELTPAQCGESCLCCDGVYAFRCCLGGGSSAFACGKPDAGLPRGCIQQSAHCCCFSRSCMFVPGQEPHNLPLVIGCCNKYFVGPSGKGV
eukprot:m.64372 g.64372  ORF g.64372 m.64372 type:complete len:187 (+) comp15877_c0_seq1:71-631(+)